MLDVVIYKIDGVLQENNYNLYLKVWTELVVAQRDYTGIQHEAGGMILWM